MKGYKVFNADWTCRGKQYTCPGEFEQAGELIICENGIHFCANLVDCFNYYEFDPRNRVAEIDAIGDIVDIVEGDNDKYCTNKIKIVRELTWEEVLKLCNAGQGNSGISNSGNWNNGNYNNGDYNNGDYNSGDWNSGDGNNGNWNSGDYNNGDYNSGDWNTGDWNKTSYSSGCFNTVQDAEIRMFNRPSGMTYRDWCCSCYARNVMMMAPMGTEFIPYSKMSDIDKAGHPESETIGGYLREATNADRQRWWDALKDVEKKAVMSLPNFDENIFYECTGIRIHD